MTNQFEIMTRMGYRILGKTKKSTSFVKSVGTISLLFEITDNTPDGYYCEIHSLFYGADGNCHVYKIVNETLEKLSIGNVQGLEINATRGRIDIGNNEHSEKVVPAFTELEKFSLYEL